MDEVKVKILEGYYDSGLSTLPIGEKKKPAVDSWLDRQKVIRNPRPEFLRKSIIGAAVVCGGVSGGLEIIDFDIKWDLTKSLMSDFRKLLDDENLLKRLVIQQSPSGGFHFIYRCELIEGNQKLAKRETSEDERKLLVDDKPVPKVVAMIETRGEGGYFLIYPSSGYKIIQGKMNAIPVLTIDEREKLHNCAKSFNLYVENNPDYAQRKLIKGDGISPFEQFNEKFDVLQFLINENWTVAFEDNEKIQLCRPGKNKRDGISATYWKDSKVFYPFTTSSEFDALRGYNPVAVYTKIKCNNDYSIASKEIRAMGFGEPKKIIEKPSFEERPMDDVWSWDGVSEFMDSLNNGTFELGLATGMERFDNHFRYKRGYLNMFNGHDNVGKTVVLLFLMLITVKRYGWKWVVYMAENSKKFFMRKAVEFLSGEVVRGMNYKVMADWQNYVKEHFFVIDSGVYALYSDMLKYCEEQRAKHKIDGMLLDPYNSLKKSIKDDSNSHDFDYQVLNEFRSYVKTTDVCIYLNCHIVSSALRKVDKEGYLLAPNRGDTEGGTKFASKADDFITLHRLTNHPTDWMITDVHVRKIREQETGGIPTPKDNPLKLKMMYGGVGFIDEYGWNPLTEKRYDAINIEKNQSNTEISWGEEVVTPAKKDEEYPFTVA